MPRWMLVVACLLIGAGSCWAQEPGGSQDLEGWIGSRLDADLGLPSGTSSELNTFIFTADAQLAVPRLTIADHPVSGVLDRTYAITGTDGSSTTGSFKVGLQTFGYRPSYDFPITVIPRIAVTYRTDTGDEFTLIDFRRLDGSQNGTTYDLNEFRAGWRRPWAVGPVDWYNYVGVHAFSTGQNYVTPFLQANINLSPGSPSSTWGTIPLAQGVAQSAFGAGPEAGTQLRWHWDALGLTANAALNVSALYVNETTNKVLRDPLNGNYSYKSSQFREWGACSARLGLTWRPSSWPGFEVSGGYRFDYFGALSTNYDGLNGMQLLWHGPFAALGYTY